MSAPNDGTDEMTRCLRALARGDESEDAERGRKMIQKLGGKGTPENARDALEAIGESVMDPDEERRDEIRSRFGGVTASAARGIHWSPQHPRDRVFPILTREQARDHLLRRARAGDLDADDALARIRGRR